MSQLLIEGDFDVALNANEASKNCYVRSGNVVLNLQSHTFSLQGWPTLSQSNDHETLTVGSGPYYGYVGPNAKLTLRNGTVQTPVVKIDGGPTGSSDLATMIVESNTALQVTNSAFYVGDKGRGRLQQLGGSVQRLRRQYCQSSRIAGCL